MEDKRTELALARFEDLEDFFGKDAFILRDRDMFKNWLKRTPPYSAKIDQTLKDIEAFINEVTR